MVTHVYTHLNLSVDRSLLGLNFLSFWFPFGPPGSKTRRIFRFRSFEKFHMLLNWKGCLNKTFHELNNVQCSVINKYDEYTKAIYSTCDLKLSYFQPLCTCKANHKTDSHGTPDALTQLNCLVGSVKSYNML